MPSPLINTNHHTALKKRTILVGMCVLIIIAGCAPPPPPTPRTVPDPKVLAPPQPTPPPIFPANPTAPTPLPIRSQESEQTPSTQDSIDVDVERNFVVSDPIGYGINIGEPPSNLWGKTTLPQVTHLLERLRQAPIPSAVLRDLLVRLLVREGIPPLPDPTVENIDTQRRQYLKERIQTLMHFGALEATHQLLLRLPMDLRSSLVELERDLNYMLGDIPRLCALQPRLPRSIDSQNLGLLCKVLLNPSDPVNIDRAAAPDDPFAILLASLLNPDQELPSRTLENLDTLTPLLLIMAQLANHGLPRSILLQALVEENPVLTWMIASNPDIDPLARLTASEKLFQRATSETIAEHRLRIWEISQDPDLLNPSTRDPADTDQQAPTLFPNNPDLTELLKTIEVAQHIKNQPPSSQDPAQNTKNHAIWQTEQQNLTALFLNARVSRSLEVFSALIAPSLSIFQQRLKETLAQDPNNLDPSSLSPALLHIGWTTLSWNHNPLAAAWLPVPPITIEDIRYALENWRPDNVPSWAVEQSASVRWLLEQQPMIRWIDLQHWSSHPSDIDRHFAIVRWSGGQVSFADAPVQPDRQLPSEQNLIRQPPHHQNDQANMSRSADLYRWLQIRANKDEGTDILNAILAVTECLQTPSKESRSCLGLLLATETLTLVLSSTEQQRLAMEVALLSGPSSPQSENP